MMEGRSHIRSGGLRFRLVLAVAGVLWAGGPGADRGWQVAISQQTGGDFSAAKEEWAHTVYPILEDSCIGCHSGNQPDGSLDLTIYEDPRRVVSDRREWRRIAERIRSREMPPPDSVDMNDADRESLLRFVESRLATLPCDHAHHAGPVTLRRLTRYEYRNTVRDLLGVNCDLSEDFPADEEGYGFDNIGDVLSVSPLLLEKYLDAAESISRDVILDPESLRVDNTVLAREIPGVSGSIPVEGGHLLTTNGELAISLDIMLEGDYSIEVEAYGDQMGEEPCEMGLTLNGKQIQKTAVEAESDNPGTYTFRRRLRKGQNRVGVSFNNDLYKPDHPDPAKRDRNLVVISIRIAGPEKMARGQFPETHRRFMVAGPDEALSPREAAGKILAWQASRAFRRPLSEREIDGLKGVFDEAIAEGASFEGAMQVVLQAILVSPHFLFRMEAPVPADGSKRQLSEFELATSLSYFLWSSMPDDELFRVAANKKLSSPGMLQNQVERMLGDSRSEALVENFAGQWLQLRRLESIDPDPELFPGYSDQLRESMIQETKLMIKHLLDEDLSPRILLTADYSFIDRTLAAHYGLPTEGIPARGFARVSLRDSGRQGLLTQASFLTLTSNPTRTSPVKRGKWVLENLLLDPPPPALADVPQLDSQKELTGTLRERMEQHRRDPNCAGCHRKMDSIGFALENFDALGRYRQTDENEIIDAVGTFPDGSQFRGASELQATLLRTREADFIRCVVEKLFIYAVGRGPLSSDDCIIDGITRKSLDARLGFRGIIMEIVRSEPFRFRALR